MKSLSSGKPSPDHPNVAKFFDRLAGLGIDSESGSVSFVCTKSHVGAAIAGMLIQVGPDARRLTKKVHETEQISAHQFNLDDVGVTAADFVRRLFNRELLTPLGTLGLDPKPLATVQTKFDDNAAIGPQQRWIALDVNSLSNTAKASPSLDWHLRSQPEPYDGLADLMGAFGVAGLGVQARLVMSILCAIDRASHISGNTANIRVRLARGLNRSQFRLGYKILQREGETIRANLVGDAFKWEETEEGAFQIGKADLNVPVSSALQCIATYADRAFHYWWISDETAPHNVRRGLLQLYDEGLGKTRKWLTEPIRRGKSRDQESSVANLLWMGGFSPIHLGENGHTSDAPDVLACTPAGHVLIVECTTGGLRSDNKLQKLLDRTLEIRQHLLASGVGYLRALPLLVTVQTREYVEKEIPEFLARGVVVATREDLEAAIVRSSARLDADEVFAEFEANLKVTAELPASGAKGESTL